MSDPLLSQEALDALDSVSKLPGSLPRTPALAVLWDTRLVMGSPARTHITSKGKSLVLKLAAGAQDA